MESPLSAKFESSVPITSEQTTLERSPTPLRSPRKIHTEPEPQLSVLDGSKPKPFKRIIVFCDGTWQDGLSTKRTHFTNVLRLARSVNYHDERGPTAIPQIVFYQAGVGTDESLYSKYVEGATGANLAEKVEDAYGFIAHNYSPGDEIFLFGFSRGAYTARMVASFIGEIGILDRIDMDHFSHIFMDFQNLGKTSNEEEKKKIEERIAPYRDLKSKGQQRADIDGDKFSIKCLGVWDTVGALGLPEEVMIPKKTIKLFGFREQELGKHIEHAFQALALNEVRADFNCNKFRQTDAGRLRKQTLKQCWFAGCHSDVGGGYKNHDLADIALAWMVSQVELYLSLDTVYLRNIIKPVAPWGKQQPHDSSTGIFLLADRIKRELPSAPDDNETHEFFHSSILEQTKLDPALSERLAKDPSLVAPLTELEKAIKEWWPYDPNSKQAQKYMAKLKKQEKLEAPVVAPVVSKSTSWIRSLFGKSVSDPEKQDDFADSDSEETVIESTPVNEKRKSQNFSTLIGRRKSTKVSVSPDNLPRVSPQVGRN